MTTPEPIGLYVHLPFCRKKCHYCDFACFAGQERHMEDYLHALEQEMAHYPQDLPVRTVYLGGGTPSLLSADQLRRLNAALETRFRIAPDAERTMEVNPATGHPDLWQAAYQCGFRRLSLGAQTFDDPLLHSLGRDHTADDTRHTLAAIRDAGIHEVSLDLMYALPDQTMDSWDQTLHHALELDPPHFSVYGLILEDRTALGAWHRQGKLHLPPEDLEITMGDHLAAVLDQHGYSRYEISSWAKPGHEALHNRIYWRNQPYVGLGTGAHSFWQQRRYENPRTITEYLRKPAPTWERAKPLDNTTQEEETAFLGLRMLEEGLDKSAFQARFGLSLEERFARAIPALLDGGLLADRGDRYCLTPRGVWLSNSVFAEFLG